MLESIDVSSVDKYYRYFLGFIYLLTTPPIRSMTMWQVGNETFTDKESAKNRARELAPEPRFADGFIAQTMPDCSVVVHSWIRDRELAKFATEELFAEFNAMKNALEDILEIYNSRKLESGGFEAEQTQEILLHYRLVRKH